VADDALAVSGAAMRLKDGVDLSNLVPDMVRACQVIDLIYQARGYECWVSSGRDGEHHGLPVDHDPWDPHYMGKAVDIRIQNVPAAERLALIDQIRLELGDQYVVLWENKGTGNEHLHCQHGRVEG